MLVPQTEKPKVALRNVSCFVSPRLHESGQIFARIWFFVYTGPAVLNSFLIGKVYTCVNSTKSVTEFERFRLDGFHKQKFRQFKNLSGLV